MDSSWAYVLKAIEKAKHTIIDNILLVCLGLLVPVAALVSTFDSAIAGLSSTAQAGLARILVAALFWFAVAWIRCLYRSRLKPFGGYLWDRHEHPYCASHRLALTRWKKDGEVYWACPACGEHGEHPASFSDEHGNEITKEQAGRLALSREVRCNPITIQLATWGTKEHQDDVTTIVRDRINNGVFRFLAETKIDGGPFNDPHEGELKKLTVHYFCCGRTRLKVVNEHAEFVFD